MGLREPREPRCEPKAGERLLLLGYSEAPRLEAWRDGGVELLIYCDRERDAVQARKKGFRAVLAQTENLEDRERFDAVVQEDLSYRIHDPKRALTRMVRALRPGGRLRIELPTEGHRTLSGRLLEEAAAERTVDGAVERIVYPEAETCRRIVRELPLEIRLCRILYRTRWIAVDTLDTWGWELLNSRALLLDEAGRRALHRRLVEKMRRRVTEEEAFLEEEVLLQIDARRDQDSSLLFSSM